MSLKHIFPHYMDVVVLAEQPTERRARSAWLGIIQVLMNYPRLLIRALFRAAALVVIAIAMTFWTLLTDCLFYPLRACVSIIVLGFQGHLADEDDPVVEGQETGRLLSLDGASIPLVSIVTVPSDQGDDT